MPLHCKKKKKKKKKHFWGLSNVLYIFFSKVGISRIAAAARSNIFTCLCGPINKALLGLFINYWANIQIICPQILSSGSTASFSTSRKVDGLNALSRWPIKQTMAYQSKLYDAVTLHWQRSWNILVDSNGNGILTMKNNQRTPSQSMLWSKEHARALPWGVRFSEQCSIGFPLR